VLGIIAFIINPYVLYNSFVTLNELREKYIKYYEAREHEVVPSGPLVPKDDPTTLFTGSGMQPLLRYFLGEPYPSGATRVVDSQKCFRAVDIEEVGDNRHTTFFEMLGNWSLGDYWKKEQLRWAFEFLVDEIGFNPKDLYVTVCIGDEENGIPKDIESEEILVELFSEKGINAKVVDVEDMETGAREGMNDGRIFHYNAEKNWWSRQGAPNLMPVGEPGGPSSEIFFMFEDVEHDPSYGEKCHPNCDCGRFLEIANSVFMEYKKIGEGEFEELPKKNIDFGGGLIRMLAAINNDPDVFKTDVFDMAIKELEKTTGRSYDEATLYPFRVIADHLRGAVFMIDEGITPSNKQQGYILRRLIRNAAAKALLLQGTSQLEETFVSIAKKYVEYYKDTYIGIDLSAEEISSVLSGELSGFVKTLEKGIKEAKEKDISAFDLYQTYGLPVEAIEDVFKEIGKDFDKDAFETERIKHKEASRTSSAGAFKGGLGGDSKEEVWYHTLTHLLHQALRDVLGDHVKQSGSNITPERLRFDFTHDKALSEEERSEIEGIVNGKISAGLSVSMEAMSLEDAQNKGALAFFKERYADIVNVYSIGDYSTEICGGPHVDNTSEIKGMFKIKKEKSNGAGVRRIRAIVE
jgi:alanyl-tRNA synthetase